MMAGSSSVLTSPSVSWSNLPKTLRSSSSDQGNGRSSSSFCASARSASSGVVSFGFGASAFSFENLEESSCLVFASGPGSKDLSPAAGFFASGDFGDPGDVSPNFSEALLLKVSGGISGVPSAISLSRGRRKGSCGPSFFTSPLSAFLVGASLGSLSGNSRFSSWTAERRISCSGGSGFGGGFQSLFASSKTKPLSAEAKRMRLSETTRTDMPLTASLTVRRFVQSAVHKICASASGDLDIAFRDRRSGRLCTLGAMGPRASAGRGRAGWSVRLRGWRG
mmetsp:Transcript_31319/g.93003  ORF Transcript_31319/g.93003 Transcript_31319/m.93003 type:complete len:279 (-) Transcript_31319:96-932(-)